MGHTNSGSSLPDWAAVCPRRMAWIESKPSHADRQLPIRPVQETAQHLAEKFSLGKKSLIWLDAVDVNTVRAAVRLAEIAQATIHVGQSTGSECLHRVITSEGWLGTTLAEVAAHADVIVTVGNGILTEAPLFASRIAQPALRRPNTTAADKAARWIHLGSAVQGAIADSPRPSLQLTWQRAEWYAKLTGLLLHVRDERIAPALDVESRMLLDHLRSARYAVWVWDADEFCSDIDELIIRRLLGVARELSKTARCSLLALDSRVGRVTAEESLLWLTGRSTTAMYDGTFWTTPSHMATYSLEDWRRDFDCILLLRTLPSVQSLPSLAASHWLVPSGQMIGSGLPEGRNATHVASVGCECSGHVIRGDRGTSLCCHSPRVGDPQLPTSLPTAEAILNTVHDMLRTQSESHVA